MDLQQLSKNIDNMVSTWDKWTSDFIKTFDADLIDINQEQMMAGEDSNGQPIGRLQSPAYIALKKSMGSKAAGKGIADLKFTGDLQRGMYTEHLGDKIYIDSKDSKAPKVEAQYGDRIWGVQKKRLDKLVQEQIEPEFIELATKKMGI